MMSEEDTRYFMASQKLYINYLRQNFMVLSLVNLGFIH